MSLTSYLDMPPIKALFKRELGNMKPLFKCDQGEPFPKGLKPTIESPADFKGGLGNVGTCFDFWFRNHLQRVNGIPASDSEFFIVYEGLNMLYDDGIISDGEHERVLKKIEDAEDLRNAYADGEEIDLDKLLCGFLIATYCQNYVRARNYPRDGGYETINRSELQDVRNLAEYTEKNMPSFASIQNKHKVEFNPVMAGAPLVGGADADLIVDNTLIDMKTTKTFGCLATQYNQLIGYYLLDKYHSKNQISDIKRLGIFSSRFNRYVYFEVEELEKQVDINYLMNTFFAMVKGEIDLHTYVPRK